MTHRWDFASLSLPDVKAKFDASNPLDTEADVTEAAHILPLSLMSADTNKTVRKWLSRSYDVIFSDYKSAI